MSEQQNQTHKFIGMCRFVNKNILKKTEKLTLKLEFIAKLYVNFFILAKFIDSPSISNVTK